MSETFRRTRLERYIKQLEVRADVHKQAAYGTNGYGRYEALKEVVAELKHEFNIEGTEVMDNKEKILAALDDSVLCDDCLSDKSGVKPRNAVNQYCRKITDQIERHTRKPCDLCKNMNRMNKVVNELLDKR